MKQLTSMELLGEQGGRLQRKEIRRNKFRLEKENGKSNRVISKKKRNLRVDTNAEFPELYS